MYQSNFVEECTDTDKGKTDSSGDGCVWYRNNPNYCGEFNDDDFNAHELCCGCKGDI